MELTPVDTSGARLALDHDVVAYAVRDGADPTAGACVEPFWYTAMLSQPEPRVPDCVTFRRGGDIYSLGGHVRRLAAGGQRQLDDRGGACGERDRRAHCGRGRPGTSTRVVRPVGDDIRTTILAQRRPDLGIDIVTAERRRSTSGRRRSSTSRSAPWAARPAHWRRSRFSDPAVLVQGSDTPPLEILGVDPPLPEGGFRLLTGESRTFAVTVRAVALGEDGIGAAVTAKDDLGAPRAAAERGVTVLVEAGESGGGPGAPEPPVIVQARATEATAPGSLDGTVAGAPGEGVTVTLMTAPIGGEDTCLALLDGPEVVGLGSVPVTIGGDGVGVFAMDAALAPGHHVYGVTIADAGVSAIGPCTVVSEATPSVSLADTEITEGTAKRGATALAVELTLSSPPLGPVSVRLTTTDGTATAPDDHTALAGQVVAFAPVSGPRPSPSRWSRTRPARTMRPSSSACPTRSGCGSSAAWRRPRSSMTTATPRRPPGWTRVAPGRFEEAGRTRRRRRPWRSPTSTRQTGRLEGSLRDQAGSDGDVHGQGGLLQGRPGVPLPASGTLRGDRFTVAVTQEGRTGKLAGKLVRKKGTLTGMLSGKNLVGRP